MAEDLAASEISSLLIVSSAETSKAARLGIQTTGIVLALYSSQTTLSFGILSFLTQRPTSLTFRGYGKDCLF